MSAPPIEFEWTLTAMTNASGQWAYRVRVRSPRGEKATDVTRAQVPARIAELCTRLGLEGVAMSDEINLAALSKMRAEQLADIDREIAEREREFEAELAELRQKRKRLVIEERELAKALAPVEAVLGKSAGHRKAASGAPAHSPDATEKMKASWTPERRAAQADRLRQRNAERAAKGKGKKRAA